MVGDFALPGAKSASGQSSIPHSERAAYAFYLIQFQRLESPVISLSHSKQKALQGREFQCPAILNEPLALFI